jgi:siroheme synthase
MKSGKIYLIGAGPGDPGLFTIKGKMLLEQGEVVIYDRLVGEEILSYASPTLIPSKSTGKSKSLLLTSAYKCP